MAKVRNNVVMRGLSGSFGDQMVIKIDKGGRTIVSNKPAFDENRAFSPAQQTQQEAFREASAYAKDARSKEEYAAKAEGTAMSTYNVAMADWFHAPEIHEIDISGWNGGVGEKIRIKALDDVQVKQVTVVITDESDVLLEQGTATQTDGIWWQYTTTAAASGNPKVLVAAEDLPGHIAKMTKSK